MQYATSLMCGGACIHYTWEQPAICSLYSRSMQFRLMLQLVHSDMGTDSCNHIRTSHCPWSMLSQGAHLSCNHKPPKRRSVMLSHAVFSCHRIVTSPSTSGPNRSANRGPPARCGPPKHRLQLCMTITSCTIRIFPNRKRLRPACAPRFKLQ